MVPAIAAWWMPAMSKVCVWVKMISSAAMKPRSPMRVTMNAFVAALARGVFEEPEPDQQVRTEADQLPEHEDLNDARSQDQAQHRRS